MADALGIIPPVRATLYLVGAACELAGIGLVAAPDLVPGARRLSQWLERQWRAAETRLRRVLRMKPREQVIAMAGLNSAHATSSASAIVSLDPNASLEEKVEYLLGRDEAAQRSANALNDRMRTLETETRRTAVELRGEVATRIEAETESAQADYRPVRIFGSVAFVVGLALTTWGNFA